MALDTTPGGPLADSYCNVAEADAYHAARGHNDAWAAADTEAKERHLKWATSVLDARCEWLGARADAEQALAWPRRGVVLDGCPLAADAVPRRVKSAVAEFAFRLLGEDWTAGLGPVVDEGVQVGPLKTSKETHRPIPSQVLALLGPLVQGSASGIRVHTTVRG
ncbi:hypothetical protein D7Y15_23150 [Corallococcus sp. AB030]|uniref:DnaT-like ssDNA-binding protein n=1 Tax=Corallococcus sp. AB030 TaxID=2316716 RepID=UPI000EBA835F|nr:DnaT-like ssDNA-binding protein [Corallococcus sp. AB030]RKI09799.1 hypothetical protein D7Y15_23150 [Corallococcus sp. AB030]